LTLAVAVIHCLIELENGTALNNIYSALYATIFEVLVFCVSSSLILSGGLRFITLLRNSEAKGLQLLGPENVANVKIRVISSLLSAAFEGILVLYFDIHSGIYNLMHDFETDSILHTVRSDMYKTLFMVLPTLALLVNLVTKMYSLWIKRKMHHSAEIFPMRGDIANYFSNEELFSVSLEAALGIPLWMIFAIFGLICKQGMEAHSLPPIPIDANKHCFSNQLYIISKNNKMKSNAMLIFLCLVKEKFIKLFKTIQMQMHANKVKPESVVSP
jgi:hypothetical protein